MQNLFMQVKMGTMPPRAWKYCTSACIKRHNHPKFSSCPPTLWNSLMKASSSTEVRWFDHWASLVLKYPNKIPRNLDNNKSYLTWVMRSAQSCSLYCLHTHLYTAEYIQIGMAMCAVQVEKTDQLTCSQEIGLYEPGGWVSIWSIASLSMDQKMFLQSSGVMLVIPLECICLDGMVVVESTSISNSQQGCKSEIQTID